MRILLLISAFFITSCSIIDPYYLNLSNEKKINFKLSDPSYDTSSQFNLFSINSYQFDSLISNNRKEYKLLILFTYWCPISEHYVPDLINCNTIDNLEIILISPDDWTYKTQYLNYQKNNNINTNIYLLDVYNYGQKRSPHYKMGKFLSEICSDCKEIKGFPSLVMFDQNNNIIYKKVGAITNDTINTIIISKL